MIFGTDGIRATVGQEPLTRETIEKLSRVLREWMPTGAVVVIGSDTRASCEMLKSWVTSHFQGLTLWDLGVAPTPVVACETQYRGAQLGIAITASHNPAEDNGLKFFDGRGLKISYQQAEAWSREVETAARPTPLPAPQLIPAEAEGYRNLVMSHFHRSDFSSTGDSFAFDFSHGAGSFYWKNLLIELGLRGVFTGDAPNGSNINRDRGALYPEHLAQLTRAGKLTAGFAFDGDGDRLKLVVPEPLHGDVALYALYHWYRQRGRAMPAVVGTILCGLGLEQKLAAEGSALIRTPVGDQHVLAEMVARDLILGGEPSGHVIQADLFPAGDGFLAALTLAKALNQDPALLERSAAAVPLYPVFESSYRVRHKPDLDSVPKIRDLLANIRGDMGTGGRLIVRYSGTETKLRVFLETPELPRFEAEIRALESAIREVLA